jgi:hypothetical protein
MAARLMEIITLDITVEVIVDTTTDLRLANATIDEVPNSENNIIQAILSQLT